MSLAPIALFSDPMEDYAAYWIKAYTQGTTTPITMATNKSGSPTVAKAEISSGGVVPIGFIKTAGDVIFIPYVDEAYDLWMFPTEAEADANDTSSAVQLADDVDALQQALKTGDTLDSSLVTYNAANNWTGGTTRTQENKNADVANVRDFGVTGSGDESVALQAALTAIEGNGKYLDLDGLTIQVDTTVTITDSIKVQNGVIDFSNATPGLTDTGPDKPNTHAIDVRGSIGSEYTLTSDATRNGKTVAVTLADSANFSVNQYAYLTSDTLYGYQGDVLGEIVRVQSISGAGVLTLTWPLEDRYQTAANATIAPLNLVEHVYFDNVRFLGGGDGVADQAAIAAFFTNDVRVNNCYFEDFGGRQVSFITSINANVTNSSFYRGDEVNYPSYGVAMLNCCQWIKVINCHFEDFRHAVSPDQVTSFGGICRWIHVEGNTMMSSRDSAFDSHTPCEHLFIKNNFIQVDADNVGDPSKGIYVQGRDISIIGNQMEGNIEWGIYFQSQVDSYTDSEPNTVIIADNRINCPTGDRAIYVRTSISATEEFDAVTITGNQITGDWDKGIFLFSQSANINYVNITNNNIRNAASEGIHLQTVGANTFNQAIINSNNIEMTSTTSGVYGIELQGTATADISNVIVNGNIILSGDVGVRGTFEESVIVTSNIITSTTETSLTASSSIVTNNL